jgi:predicted RNA methylase
VSYVLVQGQQSMTLDSLRNEAYVQALAQVITPESVVLDLGAGLGIHGLLAAKLGAKCVYLVEPEDIISVAAQIAKANGFGDRVHCLQGKIEEVKLPEQVDVITSVFTGNFLLEEDLLPSLFYARDKYLKPGGVLIPQIAIMEAVPVCVPELYQQEIESWSVPHMGIDHAPARMYASQSVYYYSKDLTKARYLAEPAKLLTLDFHQANSTYCQTEAQYTIAESGVCHGFAGWFKMQLGETWLSTAPQEPPLHWSPAFLPLDPPIEVKAGEEITFKLQRPPNGDWTWEIRTDRTQQVRSTFFSVPRSIKSLKKLAWDYQPQINDKGKAALYVLSHSNGILSVEELSHHLVQGYPHLFADPHSAINFVQSIVSRFL